MFKKLWKETKKQRNIRESVSFPEKKNLWKNNGVWSYFSSKVYGYVKK